MMHLLQRFRFHTGSIKRVENFAEKLIENKFRFHTGSIKSKDMLESVFRCESFDSILVRLKGKLGADVSN